MLLLLSPVHFNNFFRAFGSYTRTLKPLEYHNGIISIVLKIASTHLMDTLTKQSKWLKEHVKQLIIQSQKNYYKKDEFKSPFPIFLTQLVDDRWTMWRKFSAKVSVPH